MAIREVDGQFVISAYQVWRPDVYHSERTARYAFRFTEAELLVAQAEANEQAGGAGGVTFEQLKEIKKNRPPPPAS